MTNENQNQEECVGLARALEIKFGEKKMSNKLEILVTEDNEKHLADVKLISEQYINVNFTYASTLDEAEDLVRKNHYDVAVSDVFFPFSEGEEPNSYAGIGFGKALNKKNIPFVYNTSGNHHGFAFKGFLDERKELFSNDSQFSSGKVIEAYPKDSNAEADTKQWNAAINSSILLGKSEGLDDSVREDVGKILDFAPYGDYGKLTEKMDSVLGSSGFEEFKEGLKGYESRDFSEEAFDFIRSTIGEYTK